MNKWFFLKGKGCQVLTKINPLIPTKTAEIREIYICAKGLVWGVVPFN
jgi:hypothetical protein